MNVQDRRYMPPSLALRMEAEPTRIIALEPESDLKLDQRELRQLLAVKLRVLANDVEGANSTRPAAAAEVRRAVDRLRDIAGAME